MFTKNTLLVLTCTAGLTCRDDLDTEDYDMVETLRIILTNFWTQVCTLLANLTRFFSPFAPFLVPKHTFKSEARGRARRHTLDVESWMLRLSQSRRRVVVGEAGDPVPGLGSSGEEEYRCLVTDLPWAWLC